MSLVKFDPFCLMCEHVDMKNLLDPQKRSRWLQEHGALLLEHLGVPELLGHFGEVWSIGSYSNQLMQVPDLDFKIYCDELDGAAVQALGAQMASRSDVLGVRLLDFTKGLSVEASGIYLSVFPSFADELWKLDLLFLSADEPRPERSELVRKLDQLNPEQRAAILRLKAQLLERGLYAHPTMFHNSLAFHGVEVYEGVLAGVRSVDELERRRAMARAQVSQVSQGSSR